MTAGDEPVPAGWYTDPDEPTEVRWWTGEEWTHHVQPRPVPSVVARDMVDADAV